MFYTDYMGNLIITRKNSGWLDVTPLNGNGEPYEMEEGDKIIFTVASRKGEVIRKELDYSSWDDEEKKVQVYLSSEDTDIEPGLYEYDCLYDFISADLANFPRKRKVKITAGVSRRDSNES